MVAHTWLPMSFLSCSIALLPGCRTRVRVAELRKFLLMLDSKMIPGRERSEDLHSSKHSSMVTSAMQIKPLRASRLAGKMDRTGVAFRSVFMIGLVLCLIGAAFLLLVCHDRRDALQHLWTTAAVTSGSETIHSAVVGKSHPSHAPSAPSPFPSQLHQEVVRVLQTAQYKTFAALLDNMTESAVREGVTVFAPSDEALSDFQTRNTEKLQMEDVVEFHVITDVMPFSNLLRLRVGSRLTTKLSNITVLVTNATAGAFQVDDAEIVDPDLYTDAAIAVHGIDTVFNTSKVIGLDPGILMPAVIIGLLPHFTNDSSAAFKAPIAVMGVAVLEAFIYSTGLFLIYLTIRV